MKNIGVAVIIMRFLCPVSAHAQFGTTLLFLPINARTTAMTFAGVADNSDPSGIFGNPANVVTDPCVYLLSDRVGFSGFFSRGADSLFDVDRSWWRVDAGGSWRFNSGSAWTFGANAAFSKLEYGWGFYDADSDERIMSITLGAGWTRGNYELRFGGAISRVSATYNDFDFESGLMVEQELDDNAYDAGVAFAIRGDRARWNVTPQAGIATIGMGPDIESSLGRLRLPQRLNAGVSIRVASPLYRMFGADIPVFVALVNVDATSPDEDDSFWSAGAEAAFGQMAFLRIGHTTRDDIHSSNDTAWGIGLGIPFRSLRVRFDYSDEERGIIEYNYTLLATWLL